jgi:hypothetical protein
VRAGRDFRTAMPKSAASLVDMETRILSARGISVLLDADLAALYGVTPSALMQAVRRNSGRFPSDFTFQLTDQEVSVLKSQSVISKRQGGRGGRRSNPHAFTEQGVAMLSSVLRSETAIRVNVEIMRAFVRLRRASLMSAGIMKLVEDLSERVDSHDQVIGDIVESIRQLAALPPRERSRPIGFTADLESESG